MSFPGRLETVKDCGKIIKMENGSLSLFHFSPTGKSWIMWVREERHQGIQISRFFTQRKNLGHVSTKAIKVYFYKQFKVCMYHFLQFIC